MIMVRTLPLAHHRRGITLTEILIAILILGVGLASLATLFPLGLLRLREAARSTRSAYLMESAASDLVARGLLTSTSFSFADQYNLNYGLTPWFSILTGTSKTLTYPFSWQPMTQDQAYYLDDPRDAPTYLGATSGLSGGYGLPFAYDPLWRFQTTSATTGTPGYYIGDTFEARFGAGLGFIQNDPSGDGYPPSAHGLQRLTNFNRPFVLNATNQQVPIMPAATVVPTIFVSPEDVVWQEPTNQKYLLGVPGIPATAVGAAPSPVLPDLSISVDANNNHTFQPVNDWHYSWMFTGQQNNGSNGLDLRRQYRDLREPPVRNHRCHQNRPQSARGRLSGLSGRRRDGRRGDLRLQHYHLAYRGPRLWCECRSHRPLALVRESDRPRGQGGRLDRRRDLRTKRSGRRIAGSSATTAGAPAAGESFQ